MKVSYFPSYKYFPQMLPNNLKVLCQILNYFYWNFKLDLANVGSVLA